MKMELYNFLLNGGIILLMCSICEQSRALEVVQPPNDTLTSPGSDVILTCTVEETGDPDLLEWNEYISDSAGTRIWWSFDPDSIVDPNKFEIIGTYDLVIKQIHITDGGRYGCKLLEKNELYTADVSVFEELICNTSSKTLYEGDVAWIMCYIAFGSHAAPMVRLYDNSTGELVGTGGVEGSHVVLISMNISVTYEDDKRTYYCVVSQNTPQYEDTCWLSLHVMYGPRNTSIHPVSDIYHVGEEIVCSSLGNPYPAFAWTLVNSSTEIAGNILHITTEMIGENIWYCTATNTVDGMNMSDNTEVRFSVAELTSEAPVPKDTSDVTAADDITFVPPEVTTQSVSCDHIAENNRESCDEVTETACLQQGCCWLNYTAGLTCYREQVQIQPQFGVGLEGGFYGDGGLEFTLSCTSELGVEMQKKTSSVVENINSRVGSEICSGRDLSHVRVVTATSSVTTAQDQGIATSNFVLRIGSDQRIGEAKTCADAITQYLESHSNWGVPILPDLPDCPSPEFYTSAFNVTANNWICLDRFTSSGPLQISTNNLGYAIRLEGNFVTVSGEDLSPDCSNRYSAAMLERSLQVMVLVNGRIGTQVCRSIITGGMKLETATASIAVTGDRGTSSASFISLPEDILYFDAVYSCGGELSVLLIDYNTWGDPILEQIPGCPALLFQGEAFSLAEEDWVCI